MRLYEYKMLNLPQTQIDLTYLYLLMSKLSNMPKDLN